MGIDGRRSVTPPLSHRPFMALVTEQRPAEQRPAVESTELPRRRKVVPSWQRDDAVEVAPVDAAESNVQNAPASEGEALETAAETVRPLQLELTLRLEDAEGAEGSVPTGDVPEPAGQSLKRVVRGKEGTVSKKKEKSLDDVGRQDILSRANAATKARAAGKPFESYADIGKDYGLSAQRMANLIHRLRQRAAKNEKKAAVEQSSKGLESMPRKAAPSVSKQPVMLLRFDRAIEVTILGLDEYIDAKLNRLADDVISAKVKRAIATALKEGIG